MVKKLCYLPEIYNDRPGSQTIHAFNRSLRKVGVTEVQQQPNSYFTNIARHFDEKGWGRNLTQLSNRAYIVAMMWPKTARLLPVGCWAEVIPLCFDCWPKDYEEWEQVFRRFHIRTAFFTARQSAEYFSKKMVSMESLWIPEAADPTEYLADIALVERAVDVLELGRRSDVYHVAITEMLQENGFQHLYVKGTARMFPTRKQLMETWQQTKISICFPKSWTDLERSGAMETVTFRYFESIASKCLIVGHCPEELSDIFGYNPVVETEKNNLSGQLLAILSNIGKYQVLVDKNYQRMLEVGTWNARVQTMLPLLQQRGYIVEAS